MLQLMITVGNFLNSGSARAGAYGIKLKSLTKYFDTKDNAGKPILTTIFQIAKDLDKTVDKSAQEAMQSYLSKLKEDAVETELQF